MQKKSNDTPNKLILWRLFWGDREMLKPFTDHSEFYLWDQSREKLRTDEITSQVEKFFTKIQNSIHKLKDFLLQNKENITNI